MSTPAPRTAPAAPATAAGPSAHIDPHAGEPAPKSVLVDVDKLIAAYHELKPDPSVAAQRVAFGTSGHRGVSFARSFNEWHVLAITQAICEYRKKNGIDGPLYLGIDTHALSGPAQDSALEVLAANGVEVRIAAPGGFTPTPVISRAILAYNEGRNSGQADGIVVTPSHNPPDNGGFKYNPPNGGPADVAITGMIEARANALIEAGLKDVKRMPIAQAQKASTTTIHDYMSEYVNALPRVVDFDVIRGANVSMGVDPLGGAGVFYWARIAEQHRLNLTVVSEQVDPTFSFMTLDWDGRIRMDPSSPYAMRRLIGLKDKFDVAFACDTDHDRHGVVTRSAGLMPPNHYLSVLIDYLYRNRRHWKTTAAIGKTVVSTALIDRIAARLSRSLYEVPVGFKWFVDGLMDGSLAFGGEESAGATFLALDGSVWTTDKDGMVPALLSGEITARTGMDPGAYYEKLAHDLGTSYATRVDAPANAAQRKTLGKITAQQVAMTRLAGEPVTQVLTEAPGNKAAIGGVKVTAGHGWFAARPSGTEDIYKIYAESFRSADHLQDILREAQAVVDAALGAKSDAAPAASAAPAAPTSAPAAAKAGASS